MDVGTIEATLTANTSDWSAKLSDAAWDVATIGLFQWW